MVARAVSPWDILLATIAWATVLALWASAQPLAVPLAGQGQPADAVFPEAAFPEADQLEAQREAMWNSPPMLAARSWLEEYFRTSSASPPEAERAYMHRLSRLSAEQLHAWLRQLSQKRSDMISQHQVATQVRRRNVAQASSQSHSAIAGVPAQRRTASYARQGLQRPAPVNYVQRRAAGNAPILSYRYLYYLDVLDIRNDLRAIRESRR